jgi:ABC-2 type transport system permease protein
MWTLAKAAFMKEWIQWKRYGFNLLSSIVSIYIIFLIIFLGYRSVGSGQPSFGQNIEGLIVGFSLWIFSLSAFSGLSWELMQEARAGTLEQLYLCPYGFKLFSIFWAAGGFILNLLFQVPILLSLMITTGRWLHIDLLSILPLLLVSILSVYGIGYMTGGLALVYKRIQAFFQILQFVFIAFIAAPVSKVPLLKLLPLSLGTHLIRKVMVNRIPIWKLPAQDLLILVLVSFFYYLLGLGLYSYFERIARERGLLGQF